MPGVKVAIIGGTGVYNQSLLEGEHEISVETRFGSVAMSEGSYKDKTVYFLARHGGGHSVPPHLVNYRANIAALKKLGVNAIISTAAVGTLREDMPPGSRVVIDQFIDYTKNRPLTFYEGDNGLVVHTDFSEPYCYEVREAIMRAGSILKEKLVDGACYVCAEGPRFETPAEIKMMKSWGGDLVGMTNVPEVVLAREAGLCYATIALPTNYAAGISSSPLTHEEVLEEMERGKPVLDQLIASSIEQIKPGHSCRCSESGKYWPKEW
ncbi:MAG: S-methyl-5'-thioadenosine phosphorylase [Bacillota bacterium]|nr:S-methyl-5'-thioadenosine phosphorylase [Bacillota bacterium]